MHTQPFRLCLGLLLAALLLALPITARAETSETPVMVLTADHITLDQTEFEHTGSPIQPNVTVRVEDYLLTLDKEYSLTFENNTEVGTAKAVITGMAPYSGTVEIPFTIRETAPEEPEFTLIEILDSHVTMDSSEFAYTGQPITPDVTVTLEDKTLVRDRDYAVEYVNNLVPGTGTVIVRGIGTVSETLGYTGEVRKTFTILPISDSTPPEETRPGETKPDETEPETPGETQPPSPSYQITKGNGGKWFQGSTKDLSFTASGSHADFSKVSINGRTLEQEYYTLTKSMEVTLKNSFLKKLPQGQHRIVVHFTDGEASGTFTVAAGLDPSNPETGDAFPLHFLTAVLFISLTGLIGTAALWTVRRYRKEREEA